MVEPNGTFNRPVRAIGLLLILQVAGLAALGAYEFSHVLSRVDWQRLGSLGSLGSLVSETPSQQVVEALAVALFAPPAVLMLVSALGFLFMRRRGWLLAAISQGLTLGVCLWLYTVLQPVYVYPIMAYCVLVILYLNSQDVRTAFHMGRDPARERPGGAA